MRAPLGVSSTRSSRAAYFHPLVLVALPRAGRSSWPGARCRCFVPTAFPNVTAPWRRPRRRSGEGDAAHDRARRARAAPHHADGHARPAADRMESRAARPAHARRCRRSSTRSRTCIVYVVFDQLGDCRRRSSSDVLTRRFIFVGMFAFTILLALALTSTNGDDPAARSAGGRPLHRLVYVAADRRRRPLYLGPEGRHPRAARVGRLSWPCCFAVRLFYAVRKRRAPSGYRQ